MNWWCQERLSAVQLIRHPQTTFPALTSTGPAANGNDCKNCWQSMLLASSRTSKTWATQKPSTIDSAPQTPFLWPSRTDAYLHTNCRRSKSTSRVCWHRMSSSRATVRMLHQWSSSARKTGGIRLCVDYRRLNAKTTGDAYPLPRIQESCDALVGAQLFSTLDLASGYHQIAMHPDDQHKTAFVTSMGLFEYTKMPMGLSSAPATFQRLMQSTMSDFIFQFLLVYLDDLLVYSKTFDEHLAHLDFLLQRIIDAGLKLKMDKCQFLRRQVHYLGHTISAEGVSCEAGKVEAVKNWPVPATTTALASFFGFASYYRRFIQGFSKIAGPLHDLVAKGNARHKKKGADISKLWDQQHQKAFEELKTALTTAPVLGFAEFTKPFILETDASHDGLSAILSQDQDGQRRVLAYASRRLRPTEKNQANYSSMNLEFLALKWAITEKFRHYLLGAEFDVFTDNNPLVHFRTAPLGALEQRWAAQLAQFHFTVKYRPGKSNPADALSRMPPDFHPEVSSSPVPPEVAVAQELACEHQSIATAPPVTSLPADTPAKAPEGCPPVSPSLSSARLRECQLSDVTIGPVQTKATKQTTTRPTPTTSSSLLERWGAVSPPAGPTAWHCGTARPSKYSEAWYPRIAPRQHGLPRTGPHHWTPAGPSLLARHVLRGAELHPRLSEVYHGAEARNQHHLWSLHRLTSSGGPRHRLYEVRPGQRRQRKRPCHDGRFHQVHAGRTHQEPRSRHRRQSPGPWMVSAVRCSGTDPQRPGTRLRVPSGERAVRHLPHQEDHNDAVPPARKRPVRAFQPLHARSAAYAASGAEA